MTGRVCQVHGEWSASGVCRWCEPATEYDWTRGPEVATPEELARLPLAVCSFDLEDALQELWRRMRVRAVPVPTPDFDAEAARLVSQHAALRWERVQRRWIWKHCPFWMIPLDGMVPLPKEPPP